MAGKTFTSYEPPFANDPEHYRQLYVDQTKERARRLEDPNRFQPISKREDRSDLPAAGNIWKSKGKYVSLYRGFDVCKCPEDFVLYHQLFWYLKPATVIELGTNTGGMAVWISDTLKLLDISCQVYSMDIDPTLLSPIVKKLKPDNVTFLQGDSHAIEKTFTSEFVGKLPHPWVVIEDAHANMYGVLEHFHLYLKEGDYLVVEDTDPTTAAEVGMGGVNKQAYTTMGSKQLACLKSFLQAHEEYYSVDSFLTDMYGYNGSWHWHGFIRKMK